MSSWKKVLLGGAAVAALSGTSALADFAATQEPNARLAGVTGNLEFDANNAVPVDADGTLVIDDFGGVPGELQEGNQITLTLSGGALFHVLPTRVLNNCGGSAATLNYVANGGGAGASFVTYEVDNDDLPLGTAPAGCNITFDNIVVRGGTYASTDGSRIDITLTDLAGELVPAVPAGSGSNAAGPNSTVNTDRTETLFIFEAGTTTSVSPDGDDNEVTFGPLANADGPEESINLDPPSLGELFVVGAGGTATSTSLGTFEIQEDDVLDSAGNPVNADDILVTVEGPFSDGIGEIYLNEYNLGDNCPAVAPGTAPSGTISGDTATFTGLDAADYPFESANNNLDGGDGVGNAQVQICVVTDAAAQNGTLLLAGQYSVEIEITTDAGTTEGGSGNIDQTVYDNGKITRIAYAFGSGAGYSWFMPVTTMTASPVIVLVKDDDGMEWTGVLEDPQFYPGSNANGVQNENTHVLYTAGDINAAVGGTPLSTEQTRAGIWVFTADDATVGSTMLNPTGDLGSVTVFED